MSDSARIHLCLLWEDELRLAAKLVQVVNAMDDNDPERKKAIQSAWGACSAALYGLTDEKAAVMLANPEIKIRADRNKKRGRGK